MKRGCFSVKLRSFEYSEYLLPLFKLLSRAIELEKLGYLIN